MARRPTKFTLKAEYSSDAYTREQEPDSDFERKSPLNFGAEYRWREGMTLGGYYMYGDAVGFNVVVSGNPKKPLTPQDLGAGPLPVNPRAGGRAAAAPAGPRNPAARDQLAEALSEALDAEGIQLEGMEVDRDTVEVDDHQPALQPGPRAIGRAARVLQIGMPASVQTFRITPVLDGLRTTTIDDRPQRLRGAGRRGWNAGEKSWETVGMEGAAPSLARRLLAARRLPELRLELRAGALSLPADPGGPDPARPQLRPRRDGAPSRRASRRRPASASR